MWLTIALFGVLCSLVYIFLTWNYSYWKKRNVKSPNPFPLVGNLPNLITQRQHILYDIDRIYRKYKDSEDFVGIYNGRNPQLMVTSSELTRKVFITHFKNFHDNELKLLVDRKLDPIVGYNPFVLSGEEWKETRADMTPGITISKIKTVYPVTQKVCKKLSEYIKRQTRMEAADGIDGKDLALRFTSEVMSDTVLGLDAQSFSDNPTPILGMTHRLFHQSFWFLIYAFMVNLMPVIKYLYKSKFIAPDVENFFVDLMVNAIQRRKAIHQSGDPGRSDFLNYMIQLQEKKNLSMQRLTANTMTFLIDGFETTAAVISSCLLLLGRHPDVQEKLRSEIASSVDENGELDFDTIIDLPYMDACVHEALRLFPPGVFTLKICTIPIDLTNRDGTILHVEEGIVALLPLYSIMRDENNYENPDTFNPERFMPENGGVKKYKDMGLFYGFGEGPRICIGMRFALVQLKSAIAEIVQNFEVGVNPKTRNDDTLDPKSLLPSLKDGVWLTFSNRK